MKYNLAQNSYISPNLIEGNKSLIFPQLTDLVIENDANITLSGSDILAIELDLGERILADEIRYYFSSSTIPSTVVSGISFYIRRDAFTVVSGEPYSKIDSCIGPTYYYATITGTAYAPRSVKLVHTVSGTSISGTATALQVINNEDIVNFGPAGDRTAERFDLSLYFDPSDIKEVAIYNNNTVSADAYVTIEPQYGLIDGLLEFGPTASGEWYGLFDPANKICGPDRWNSYYTSSYDSTQFNNTYIYNNAVKLYADVVSGTYTTCVFGGNSPAMMPMLMDVDYPVLSSGVAFYDDFNTQNGSQWQVNTGSVSYSASDITITNGSTSVITKNTINFGSDWEVLMKIRWVDTGNGTNFYSSYYPYYASSSENVYLYVRSNVNNIAATFNLNGASVFNVVPVYNPNTYTNQWFWFRVKRTPTTLYFKLWLASGSEPSSWTYSMLLNRAMLPSIYSNIYYISYHQISSGDKLDDISVWSNCAAVGETNHLIAVDSTDTMETIAMKSSNAIPEAYNVYTTYTGIVEGGNYIVKSILRYFKNDQIISQTNFWNESNYYPWTGYGVVSSIDETDETVWAVLFASRSSSAVCYMRICRWKQLTNAYSTANVFSKSGSTISCSVKFLAPNKDVGCWLYFYTSENVMSGAGYYLSYFNSSLARAFTIREVQNDFVAGMSLANANGDLWYANKYNNTVLKINITGTVLASYDAISSVGYVCSAGDDGCYFLQDEAIVRLDASAQVSYSLNVGQYISVFNLDKDVDGHFWLLYQNSQIVNVNYEGVVQFSSEYYTYFITDIYAVVGGVWFKSIDDKTCRFFDRAQKKVTKIVVTPVSGGVSLEGLTNTPLFFSKAFKESDFDNRFPTPVDTYWQNLSWRKVSPKNYILPNDKYHQVKFTLRASTPGGVSPILNSFYRQHSIKVDNIQPGQTKNIYIKADISSLTELDLGHYTSNLRTWWYIPE